MPLYASLYVSCQSRQGDLYVSCQRQGDLVEFPSYLNHEYPSSLSEYSKIRKPNAKNDFLDCLAKVDVTESFMLYEEQSVDAYVIDGPAFFHLHPPTISKTFGEQCKNELAKKIKALTSKAERIDIVFHQTRDT